MNIQFARELIAKAAKRRSGRALTARRQTIWRRVLRHGALRAVGGKSRGVVCSALFERVFTWFCGDAGGSVLSLPELNWCYAIRRRVGGNAGVYLGMLSVCCCMPRCAYEVGKRP